MKQQVIFYGSVEKASAVLASIQATIVGVRKDADRGHPASRELLNRYTALLEEIEIDVVALCNAARSEEGAFDFGGDAGSSDTPNGPLHHL